MLDTWIDENAFKMNLVDFFVFSIIGSICLSPWPRFLEHFCDLAFHFFDIFG